MEKSMQQVQSEQEKMVPIDTSGDPVDVEIKDSKDESQEKIETKEPEVVVEEQSKQTTKNDELDEYSESVKKRIDKLTKKMREAERREAAALEYAEKIKKQNENLEAKTKELDSGYTAEFKERVNTQSEVIKDNLKRALLAKDNDAVVKAQEQLAQIAIDQQRLKEAEKLLSQKEEVVNSPKEPEKPAYQKPDPRAEQWAEDNEWFGKDEVMTYAAFGIHKRLVEQEALDPKSEEYYKELDNQMRKEFPHKFGDTNKTTRQSVPPVASANRSTKSGRRTVRLTPSQVAIAKKLGVPLEEYAKHVKEA
jgi:hypothetical protein